MQDAIMAEPVKGRPRVRLGTVICFIFAFGLVFIGLMNVPTLASGADPKSIWETIISFYSGDIQPSYVLYKGIHSVYPYVWLYRLSQIFGRDSFFFIKIYYALLFAYATAIGMPYIVTKLLNKNTKLWTRLLSILICYIIWTPFHVFTELSVDLPAMTYLIIAVVATIKFSQIASFTPPAYFFAVIVGALIGFASLGSGQFELTALFLPVYVIIHFFRINPARQALKRFKKTIPLICVFLLISGIASLWMVERNFEKTVVEPLNIRSGMDWVIRGLTRDLTMSTWNYPITKLPDNRGEAILREDRGHTEVNQAYEATDASKNANGVTEGWANPFQYSLAQYIKLALKHPLDFFMRFCNRLFYALDMDNGKSSILRIFTGFTLLYLALYAVFKRCKTLRSFFKPGLLIVAAFVVPVLISCFLQIEKRYTISLLVLVTCVGLFDDTLKNAYIAVKNMADRFRNRSSLNEIMSIKIFYPVAIYAIFIIVCFLHHATIMETLGPSISILFTL